jgi:hypothetical protein
MGRVRREVEKSVNEIAERNETDGEYRKERMRREDR